VAFTAYPRGGAGGYSCTWDFGNGSQAHACSTSHAFSSPGMYNVSVTASDANGTTASSQAQVRIASRLVARVDMTPEKPTIGQTATFTAVPAGGSGTYECVWTFDGSDGNVTGCQVTHAWDKAGSYLVSVVVTDSENRSTIVLRSVDVATDLVSASNLLLLIPAAIAVGLGLQVWLHRRGRGLAWKPSGKDGDATPPDPEAAGTLEIAGPPAPPSAPMMVAPDPHFAIAPDPRNLFPTKPVGRDTAASALVNRDSARAFLHMDPVGNAVVWDRAFQQPHYDVYTEGRPTRGLVAVHRTARRDGANFVAMHAIDLDAASALCEHLPKGFTIFHLTEEFPVTLLARRADEFHPRPAWLFQLDPRELVDHPDDRVRPLAPEWAAKVATLWRADWPAEPYVRERIEGGPTAAIYEDGEPVAWALTHTVTDRVGIIGMVHVVEDHRRKGLAKSVVAAVSRALIESGKLPALHAYPDNAASLALFPTLGYRQVKLQVWGEAVFR